MFFQNGTNLDELGKNWESMVKLIMEKSEKEIIQTVLYKINSLYCGDPMIQHFLYSIKKHRKEIFLYLDNPDVEKTSDKSEQHFSIQSWLLKHRFKTKDRLLQTSYWYHRYLSTWI